MKHIVIIYKIGNKKHKQLMFITDWFKISDTILESGIALDSIIKINCIEEPFYKTWDRRLPFFQFIWMKLKRGKTSVVEHTSCRFQKIIGTYQECAHVEDN